jgi:hypothetical protein
MLFFFVRRIVVSEDVEHDFSARWSVSRGISKFIVFSVFDRQI